jgi:hypothetical protein
MLPVDSQVAEFAVVEPILWADSRVAEFAVAGVVDFMAVAVAALTAAVAGTVKPAKCFAAITSCGWLTSFSKCSRASED